MAKKSNLVVIDRDPPNLLLVGMLQSLLDRAKRGEIYGAVVVAEVKDRQVTIANEVRNKMSMIGGLEFAKMQLLIDVASRSTDDANTDSTS